MIATLLLAAALGGPQLPELLVERRLADSLALAVGDTVRVGAPGAEVPRPFAVAGIFERAADPSRISRNELELRLQLPDLEALLPVRDRVDRIAVTLAPGADTAATARWIEGVAYGVRAHGSAALAGEASATFLVVSRFNDAIGIVTILASAIFLLCVMTIRVDERKPDLATLRLLGVGRATVFRAVVAEAIGVALVGSVAGGALGAGVAHLVNLHYARVYDTTLRFALVTPRILALAAGLGLVLGAVAGVLAAWRVVRVAPQRLGER